MQNPAVSPADAVFLTGMLGLFWLGMLSMAGALLWICDRATRVASRSTLKKIRSRR